MNFNERASRVLELLLLAASFVLLVPPVPSDVDAHYRFLSLPFIAAVVLFLGAQFFCVRRGGDNWFFVALRMAGFIVFGYILFLRSFM